MNNNLKRFINGFKFMLFATILAVSFTTLLGIIMSQYSWAGMVLTFALLSYPMGYILDARRYDKNASVDWSTYKPTATENTYEKHIGKWERVGNEVNIEVTYPLNQKT